MDWVSALLLLLGLLCALMITGLPVAFVFFAVNLVGAMVFLGGDAGLRQLARNSVSALTTFTLAPIPLFLLMGEILFRTGAGYKAIDAVDKMIARVPGRLAVVSVAGGTVFASLSGSSIANTAVLGRLLLPDMLRRGYHPSMAMGPIMATGGIAMLIPPSALAVLLGSLAGISISRLLIAGTVPGVIMSVLFLGYVMSRSLIDPALAPAYDVRQLSPWERIRPFLFHVVPLFGIFVAVVGSILAGVATPTESAALGCLASIGAVALYRELRLPDLLAALLETAKTSVMILFIIVASVTFSQILAFSGASGGLLDLLGRLEVPPRVLLIGMLSILLFLGMFVDQVSMVMITLPLFVPLAQAHGIDLMWLGVLMLIAMEISFLTPPFGLLLYVMKGVAPPGTTMQQIILAATPFVVLELIVMVLLVAFPSLATWLPELVSR